MEAKSFCQEIISDNLEARKELAPERRKTASRILVLPDPLGPSIRFVLGIKLKDFDE